MLKSIATACSEVHSKTRQQGELQQTTLFLISLPFLAMIENRSKRRMKTEIFIFVKNNGLTKDWILVSNL